MPAAHVLPALPLLPFGTEQHLLLSQPLQGTAQRPVRHTLQQFLRDQPEIRPQSMRGGTGRPDRILYRVGLLRAIHEPQYRGLRRTYHDRQEDRHNQDAE